MRNFLSAAAAAFMMTSFSSNAQAQNWTLNGQVLLGEGLPLSNVEVRASKSKSVVKSDSLGFFQIEAMDSDRLIFKNKPFYGKSVRVSKANAGDTIRVFLDLPTGKDKLEIAIGYGYIKENDRTDAAQALKAKKNYAAYTTIWEIIKEKFTNIQILNNGCVIVRGLNSFNGDPCALFVVDGSATDSIDYLLPSDIKEITLLKDGSASIYGARGGNGVFIINTFKAEEN